MRAHGNFPKIFCGFCSIRHPRDKAQILFVKREFHRVFRKTVENSVENVDKRPSYGTFQPGERVKNHIFPVDSVEKWIQAVESVDEKDGVENAGYPLTKFGFPALSARKYYRRARRV